MTLKKTESSNVSVKSTTSTLNSVKLKLGALKQKITGQKKEGQSERLINAEQNEDKEKSTMISITEPLALK